MNGPQDLGGKHGFGPVVPEPEGELFHADWEKRVLGNVLAAAALGYWNIDASRHARESLSPTIYYNASYYEIWQRAMENILLNAGEITVEELDSGQSHAPGKRAERRLPAEAVSGVLAKGSPSDRPGPAPTFAVGDQVKTLNHQPEGHTRLPGYARGCTGTIIATHGCHVFPDSNAHFQGEDPQPLYTVAFSATALYGADADPTLTVHIEAWEPYLEWA